MSISGHGEGTAGPALHADVLAGLNDEQRAGDLLAHLYQLGHGHPTEWDKARPLGAQRLRGRPRHRSG